MDDISVDVSSKPASTTWTSSGSWISESKSEPHKLPSVVHNKPVFVFFKEDVVNDTSVCSCQSIFVEPVLKIPLYQIKCINCRFSSHSILNF